MDLCGLIQIKKERKKDNRLISRFYPARVRKSLALKTMVSAAD